MARASIELHRIATDVAAIPDAGLFAAAKLVKKIALEEAGKVASGGDLTGKRTRKPIRLKARDMGVRTVDDGRAILIVGSPAGVWVWVTTGTAPHAIRRRKKGPMKKMTVHHPGTRGKHAWTHVVTRAEDLVPRIFQDLADRAV